MVKIDVLKEILPWAKGRSLEEEKKETIQEALALDKAMMDKEISKPDYEATKKHYEQKLKLIDTRIAIEKISDRMKKLAEEQKTRIRLNDKRQEKVNEILTMNKEANLNIKEAAKLFAKKKLALHEFEVTLEERYEEIIEDEESLKEIYRQQLKDKEEQSKILLKTAEELENHRMESMAQDIAGQKTPKGDRVIWVPKHHDAKLENLKERRKHRHAF